MIALILRFIPLIIASVIAAGSAWMIQGWRYGAEIETIQRVHADTMAEISRVAARQLQAQMDRHKEQVNEIILLDKGTIRSYKMHSKIPLVLVLILPLLISGCQSAFSVAPPATCLQPPAPPAWMMEPSEPNYTQRMQRLLQPLPVTPIVAP